MLGKSSRSKLLSCPCGITFAKHPFYFLCLVLLFGVFSPTDICLQPALAAGPELLNSAAAESAAKNIHRAPISNKRIPAFLSQTDSDAVKDAAELDTVHDILRERSATGGTFSPYRSPFYLSYVYDVVPIPDFDDWIPRSETERLLLYQSTVTLTKFVVNSGLEQTYRDVIRSFRWFQDYTTLRVSPEQHGGVEVANGKSAERPLVEFKLHLSANEGLEPRITLGGAATLRYNVIENDVLVEYRHDF